MSSPTTQVPYRLYGSQQDNTAMSLPSFSPLGAITQQEWFEPGGGESGYLAVNPKNPDIVFGGAIGSGAGNGRLTRFDRRTGQERNVTVWPDVNGMGNGAKELKYRFQWTFPLFYSTHEPDALYATSNVVHRSTDEGQSWSVVSPDLTRNDVTKMEASGGPITKDNTGAEVYGTIFAFVESPHEQGVFWAGSDDGLIHISRDGGKTWENVTPKEIGEWALISVIEPSPHDPATAYVAATRYKSDDYTPLPAEDERLRQDLDDDHQGHRRQRDARHPRGPGAARAACTRAPRRASTSPSMTAGSGTPSPATCPSARSTT